MAPAEVDAEAGPDAASVEDPDRLGLALERRRRQFLVVDREVRRLPGREPDGDTHLGRNGLDARRRVDGVADDEGIAGRRRRGGVEGGLTGVDDDAAAEPR